MQIFPEDLLIRRYAIQADLWGMRRELGELERDLARAYEALHGIQKNVDSLQRLSKPAIKQSERHLAAIAYAKERSALVSQLLTEKREELVTIEGDLRAAYKSLRRDVLSAEMPTEGERVKETQQVKVIENHDCKHSFDVFISHASEDKNDLVRPLAIALRDLSLKVWYDEWILKVGDGLRGTIDNGLINSRFGVIVLSPNFLTKHKWTTYELDSLFTREIEQGKVILPLWHKVTKDEVLAFSPKLADKFALNTTIMTIEDIAFALAEFVTEKSDRHTRLKPMPLP